ncbi:MAG TPA: hypothetical protein PKM18_11070, partial [bacterium]|nr:hypothetical protein [bacterium]
KGGKERTDNNPSGASKEKSNPATLSEHGSGTRENRPGMGFWITRYIAIITGWYPPSVRFVILYLLTTAVYLKWLHWNTVSAVIGGIIITVNLLCTRTQRLFFAACEIGLLYWLGPQFIKAALFNHGVFLVVYLLSLEIIPSFRWETETERN